MIELHLALLARQASITAISVCWLEFLTGHAHLCCRSVADQVENLHRCGAVLPLLCAPTRRLRMQE